jgi:peptide chain release factor subunit 1
MVKKTMSIDNEMKLKKLVKELEAIRGRHTELVSVYIPSGYSITDVIGQLKDEQGTASNIKSKATRKNVLSALEKIVQHLRVFKQTPPNGMIVFAGNISSVEGKEEIELWSFEPPVKMKTKIYWCDQTFVLDPLKEMVREREVYGLIVLDAKEANIGLLVGKSVEALKEISSTVMSKTVKGGMSQHRYDRIREEAINDFLTKVGEQASKIFLEEKDLKGVIIGGPGPIKERFAKEDYLNYQIKNKLLGVKDVSYTGDYGLQELVQRSEDLLAEAAVVHEKQLIDKFFTFLQKDGLVTYGAAEVLKALENGSVDTLLVSEDFDWRRVKMSCQCGYKTELDMPMDKLKNIKSGEQKVKCDKCKGDMEIVGERDMVEILTSKVDQSGAKMEYISTSTTEGQQFKELGGIGALLRFKL